MALLIAVLAAIAGTPPPAYAVPAPYPAEPPASSISDGTVEPGGSVTFSGGGFLPYEKVSISVDYGVSDNAAAFRPAALRTILTTTADGKGFFSISVRLHKAGTATIKAVGQTSGVSVVSTVEVAPAAGRDGGRTPGRDDDALPTTGPSIAVGTASILVGAVVLMVTRKRRRRVDGWSRG